MLTIILCLLNGLAVFQLFLNQSLNSKYRLLFLAMSHRTTSSLKMFYDMLACNCTKIIWNKSRHSLNIWGYISVLSEMAEFRDLLLVVGREKTNWTTGMFLNEVCQRIKFSRVLICDNWKLVHLLYRSSNLNILNGLHHAAPAVSTFWRCPPADSVYCFVDTPVKVLLIDCVPPLYLALWRAARECLKWDGTLAVLRVRFLWSQFTNINSSNASLGSGINVAIRHTYSTTLQEN